MLEIWRLVKVSRKISKSSLPGTGTAFDRMLKRPTVKKAVDAEQNLSTS
jgi:hypothetical protein